MYGTAMMAGQSPFSLRSRRTLGVRGLARRGKLLVELHLMSVTITTEIPGVGGVSRPGERNTIRNSRMQYDTNFKSQLSTYIQNVTIPY